MRVCERHLHDLPGVLLRSHRDDLAVWEVVLSHRLIGRVWLRIDGLWIAEHADDIDVRSGIGVPLGCSTDRDAAVRLVVSADAARAPTGAQP